MNRTSALIIAAATASLVGFAPASLYAQASSTEKPVPAEKNPPGDIPDNQVFIEYQLTVSASRSKCRKDGLAERPRTAPLLMTSTTRSRLSCRNAPTQ